MGSRPGARDSRPEFDELRAPAAEPDRRAPGPGRLVDVMLHLQRQAGNAAVARFVAQTKADTAVPAQADEVRSRLDQTLAFHQARDKAHDTQIFQDLARYVAAEDGPSVVATLRGLADRMTQAIAAYRDVSGKELRRDLLETFSHTDPDLVRALALLHSGNDTDPYAQVALALLPAGTRDTALMRLLEERSLSARRMLERDFEAAYRGISPGGGDLRYHLQADLTGWRLQRATALLDHDLTQAEHLHFHTTGITGTHQPEALAILQAQWDQGPRVFLQFSLDWRSHVMGPGWTKLDLRKAMLDELTGENLGEALAIFSGYDKWLHGKGADDNGMGKVTAAREQLAMLLDATVFVDHGQVIKATARLRKAWEEVIAKDPTKAPEWENERQNLEAQVKKELHNRVTSMDQADSVEAAVNLHREQSLADKAWLAHERRDDKTVLKLVTEAWMGGADAQAQMLADAKKGNPPRPSYDARVDLPRGTSTESQKVGALLNYNLDHSARGAQRLSVDFQGRGKTSHDELKDAYDFLQSIKDEGLRERVVANFVLSNPNLSAWTWKNKFAEFVEDKYENSVLRVDMLHLVVGEKDQDELLKRAEEREKASHTGLLDPLTMGLAKFYDLVTAEDSVEVADDSLRRFRQFVRNTNATQTELKAMLEREGAKDVSEIASMSFTQFKARLDEVREVKGAAGEVIGMIVDFAGRSALVALFGPAGLAGLGAALGAYAGGMLVREGMLGADYQLVSKENLSTLAAEMVTFGFDELRIERVIGEVFALDPVKHLQKAAAIAARDEKIIKGVQDGIKQMATKFFEKSVQNAIEGKGFPSVEQIFARALHAIDMGTVKGASSQYAKKLNVFSSKVERFRTNVISIMMNGPPPKAALAMSLTKELTDLVLSGQWQSLSGAEITTRMSSVALQSAMSAIPVAAALGVHAENTAMRGRDILKGHPEILRGMALADPKIAAGYNVYKLDAERLHGDALDFDGWWQLRAKAMPTIRSVDPVTKEPTTVNLRKWYADQAKSLESVIVPQPVKDKVGLGT